MPRMAETQRKLHCHPAKDVPVKPSCIWHTSPWIQTCHLLTHCMKAQQFISGCIMLVALVTEACWKLTLDTFLGFEYHASSPLSSYWLLQGSWVKNKEKETQYCLQKDFFFLLSKNHIHDSPEVQVGKPLPSTSFSQTPDSTCYKCEC